ncbi:TPA: type II restriction endonuclease subunit R, partial [Enterobacter bugandensis]
MPNTTIKQLVIDCSNLSSEMSISYGQVAPSFIFSNTGRRNGAKYFAITLPQIISVLENIKDNLSEFSKYPNYNESHWRDLFPEYITDKVINALSTVQTLPLFALLNKIITVVNNDIYHEKTIDLTPQKLQTTIDYLKNQMPSDEEITVTSNNSSLLSI